MTTISDEIQTRVMPPAQPVRRTDVRIHELDGEALVYDAASADTHRLNTTAHFIWRLCDGEHDIEAIARELTEVYEVSPTSAREHTERMIAQLHERNLLVARE